MAFTVQVPTSFGCSPDTIFSLPTKEDLVNALNQIAQIPSQLRVALVTMADELTEDLRNEIKELIKTIEDFIDKLQKLLSPYWEKLKVRDWQKEINDAITELIQEFHIYIPRKIAEIISKIIPVELVFKFAGLAIDIVRIFDPTYQSEIRAQILANVDKFFNAIPEKFRSWRAEFGVLCDEWKAKVTWQYIKTEIQAFLTGGLHGVFGKLIDKFSEIWDALGLPSLIKLFTIPDIGALIDNAIQSFMERRRELLKKLQDLNLTQKAKEAIREELKEISEKISEALNNLSVFGFDILSIIGGKIKTTVQSLEQQIMEIKIAFQDFCQNWQKKLLFDWVKIVKKFFSAIGLGKIFDFLVITFCDFLKLIGFPPSIPTIVGVKGVMSVQQTTPNNDNSDRIQKIDSETQSQVSDTIVDGKLVQRFIRFNDAGSDDGVASFTADGKTDTFSIPSGDGTVKVFVDGQEQSGLPLVGSYSISGGSVIFNTDPLLGSSVSIIKV